MAEFLFSKFPDCTAAHQASIAVDKLRARGTTIYGWAVICKNSDGRVSVLDRKEYQGKPAAVAALIGGLAGFAASPPFGAIPGAISGALIGYAADSVDRQAHVHLLDTISHEIGRNHTVLIAEVASEDIGSFEALIGHCGGTIVPRPYATQRMSLPAR